MSKTPAFETHVMFCNSTGNNTVNMIPALQLRIKSVFVISTEYTERGLTGRLLDVMKDYKIKAERISITKDLEKDIITLTKYLVDNAKDCERIVWNISGGQKMPIIAFYNAFQKRINDGYKEDVILYMEATPPEIWFFGNDYKTEHLRSKADLSLSAILHLYGSMIVEDNRLYPEPSEEVLKRIMTGRQAFRYFREYEWFREVFFNSMKPEEAYTKKREEIEALVRRSLDSVKPKLDEIALTSTGYEDFIKKMDIFVENIKSSKSLDEAQKIVGRFKMLNKPSEIYKDYWNSIKKRVVERVLENIEHKKEKLLQDPFDEEQKNKTISAIRSIGGEIEDFRGHIFYKDDLKRFSFFRTGILFEWMVASHVIDIIEQNGNIKNSIVSIHMGVKTKKANDPNSKVDTEIDIVITTKCGTLLFLEMKTHDLPGDLVKSKESTAYKKSGTYGKAVMVGPLLKSMVKEKDNGEKVYPHYIDGKTKDQENTAKQNNVKYVYVDKIDLMLKEELFCNQ